MFLLLFSLKRVFIAQPDTIVTIAGYIKIQFTILRKRVFPISTFNRSYLMFESIRTDKFLFAAQLVYTHNLQLKLNYITRSRTYNIYYHFFLCSVRKFIRRCSHFSFFDRFRGTRGGGGGLARSPTSRSGTEFGDKVSWRRT